MREGSTSHGETEQQLTEDESQDLKHARSEVESRLPYISPW